MDKPRIANAPGLKWRRRQRGWVPMWIPRADVVERGFPADVVPLEYLLHDHAMLADRCRALQAEMLLWLNRIEPEELPYDGTIGSVLKIYELDEDSPFKRLKPGSQHPYAHYLARLQAHIGGRRIDTVTSKQVRGWYREWTRPGKNGRPKIAAGRMAVIVLKEALTYAAGLRHSGCRELRDILAEMRFKAPKARAMVASAADVVKARKAAHAIKRPSLALAYAIQFETLLRQWDVIDDLSWQHIDEDMILRFTPGKTAETSGAKVVIDLKLCPMVLEEIGERKAIGPVVLNEMTKRRWSHAGYTSAWDRIRDACGLPAELWNRDLRASGVTEARAGGGSNDDNAKVAGHSKPKTTAAVYDRERLEAQRRVAAARIKARTRPGT